MPVAKPQGHQVEGHCRDPGERRSLGQRGQVVQMDRGGSTGLFPIAGMRYPFLRSGVEEKNQLWGRWDAFGSEQVGSETPKRRCHVGNRN